MTMTSEDIEFCKEAHIEPFEIPDSVEEYPMLFTRQQACNVWEIMRLVVFPVVTVVGVVVCASYLIAKNL